MNRDTAKDGYLREVMSMHHSHDNIGKLIPQVPSYDRVLRLGVE